MCAGVAVGIDDFHCSPSLGQIEYTVCLDGSNAILTGTRDRAIIELILTEKMRMEKCMVTRLVVPAWCCQRGGWQPACSRAGGT